MSSATTPEEEAALRVHFLRPLLPLALRPRPTEADWDAADPHRTPRSGDIAIVRDGPHYAQVLTSPNDAGQVLTARITRHGLTQAAKSLTPEMVHPDFAKIVGADARHRVLGEWALGERLSKLTDDQRADAGFLRRDVLGGLIGPATDPVELVRKAITTHRANLTRYRTRENHVKTAHDAAYRPALLIQQVIQAFPSYPEMALVTIHKRLYHHSAVRPIGTAY